MLAPSPITGRWTELRPHATQFAYWTSPHRFNVVSAGRRSGKTELAKRKMVRAALVGTTFPDARFAACAPTRDQARGIYWNDFKQLVPRELIVGNPRETDPSITLINASEIHVIGMDKPERIEGRPWDGLIMDEYGNMKETAWQANVRPALSDRLGWCDFIGVPEGRNHYFDLWETAVADMAADPLGPWGAYTWFSADILPASEIDAARKDMHPLMFQQEYEGSFIQWAGVAIFDPDKWLVQGPNGKLVPCLLPETCDAVFAVIDTAIKSGSENDSTGVSFYAYDKHGMVAPLIILDWNIVQIDGALLETWLPTVFQRLEQLSQLCHARRGSLGAFIEDVNSGTILLQQAQRRGWPAHAIDLALTGMGKDERALSVSGYHYNGKIKIAAPAYTKTVMHKGAIKNHLLAQVTGFRVGDKDESKRADDLLDTYCYSLAISLGNKEGW